eukprot:5055798-Pleurochrysis_carterae.AAC.3
MLSRHVVSPAQEEGAPDACREVLRHRFRLSRPTKGEWRRAGDIRYFTFAALALQGGCARCRERWLNV